ncbi:MAG: hypothetical protein ACM33B_09060 [Pseudomonadota bacterium]
MIARTEACVPSPASGVGAVVGVAGLGLVAAGLWGRFDVARALARERVVLPEADPPGRIVAGARDARAMAEFIRRNTLETTAGRTYAETDPYVDPDGRPTAERALAATDERTGEPVESPDHALWIQSTTLQTALMQAYVAFRLSELTIALGGAFVAVGLGLAAGGRR